MTMPSSFSEVLHNLKGVMKATIDPAHWHNRGTMADVQRATPLVAMLTMLEQLEVKTKEGKSKVDSNQYFGVKVTEEGLEVGELAVYIAMGGRVILEYDKNLNPELVVPALFGCNSQEELDSIKEGDPKGGSPILAPRLTSTHGLTLVDGEYKEVRSISLGARKALQNTLGRGSKKHKEYGVDLAIGGIGNEDINSNPISADGSHGHMLLYEKKPSIAHGGALMVGIENCGFNKESIHGEKHGISGTSTATSPFGTQKFRSYEGEGIYFPGTELPMPALTNERKEPLGELRVQVTPALLDHVQQTVRNYTAYAKRCSGITVEMERETEGIQQKILRVRSASSIDLRDNSSQPLGPKETQLER